MVPGLVQVCFLIGQCYVIDWFGVGAGLMRVSFGVVHVLVVLFSIEQVLCMGLCMC